MNQEATEVREASAGYAIQVVKPSVPVGYKQTEVGVTNSSGSNLDAEIGDPQGGGMDSRRIPEDWNAKSIGELSEFITSGSRGWAAYYSEHGALFIRSQNVRAGRLDFKDSQFVTPPQGAEGNRTRVNRNDLLITITGNSVGNVALIEHDFDEAYISQHVGLVRLKEPKLAQYVCRFLSPGSPGNNQIWASQSGQSKPGLTLRNLYDFWITLPPTEAEQRAIATALSDVDALLEELDRLITKKYDLKQATMQQLLTGQTRLPGFKREWKIIRLGDHVRFLNNGTNSRAELLADGSIRYLHYGDIHTINTSVLDPVSLPCLPSIKAKVLDRLQDGDLIFADASEDIEGVGKSVELVNVGSTQLVSGLHTIAARFDQAVLADGFKAYLQFCPEFISALRRLAAGTKVYATTRSHIANIEMRLPKVDEQKAIAAVFQDMDAEIEVLEQRRTKTAAIKQAMMQELLTGHIRLVESVTQVSPDNKGEVTGRKANVHFIRSVLAAEIVDQLHEEPTFGHVKFEKMLFLVEHLCNVDTGSNYQRKAAGPYDNRALRSIDSQLQKQQWFEARKENGRYRYVPLSKKGGHKDYFDRYFSEISTSFQEIIKTFRSFDTEQCEIVATLFSAWKDLLSKNETVTDEVIVHEVLHNWHESKKRISEERWLKALGWMRKEGIVPK